MKNPNEKLEQLRRSSLVEFEHLKNDSHPDPPLRALPEHSVLHEEGGQASHSLPSGPSVLKNDKSSTSGSISQQSIAQQVPAAAGGIAAYDFAHTPDTGNETQKSTGGLSSSGFFVSSTENFSTSSLQSVHQSSIAKTSSSQEQSTSSGSGSSGQITSGKMTFNIPDFGQDDTAESTKVGEDVISPTHVQEEGEEGKKLGIS